MIRLLTIFRRCWLALSVLPFTILLPVSTSAAIQPALSGLDDPGRAGQLAADFDGDRHADLVAISSDRVSIVITLSTVSRRIELTFSKPLSNLVALDVDRDGDNDLIGISHNSPIVAWTDHTGPALWINDSRGSFIAREILTYTSISAHFFRQTEPPLNFQTAVGVHSLSSLPERSPSSFPSIETRRLAASTDTDCFPRAPPAVSALTAS